MTNRCCNLNRQSQVIWSTFRIPIGLAVTCLSLQITHEIALALDVGRTCRVSGTAVSQVSIMISRGGHWISTGVDAECCEYSNGALNEYHCEGVNVSGVDLSVVLGSGITNGRLNIRQLLPFLVVTNLWPYIRLRSLRRDDWQRSDSEIHTTSTVIADNRSTAADQEANTVTPHRHLNCMWITNSTKGQGFRQSTFTTSPYCRVSDWINCPWPGHPSGLKLPLRVLIHPFSDSPDPPAAFTSGNPTPTYLT
jgi:hypothetical protein